jgi:AAA-like domain
MAQFHLRGPIPVGGTSFVARPFGEKVVEALLSRRWVLLLGPRQHGKSTELLRISSVLKDAGFLCARVDLQALPPIDSYSALLEWFARRVARSIGMNDDLNHPASVDSEDLASWLRLAMPLGARPVVVLVDEVSAISNATWRESFFGQLRSIANEAASSGPESLEGRLLFVFAGTFRPESLVNELNSPFNVCDRVETSDLTLNDTLALASRVDRTLSAEVAKFAYKKVGGQPYLVQFLLSKASGLESQESQMKASAAALELVVSGVDGHLESVFGTIIASTRLTEITISAASEGGCPNVPADADYRYLQVLGAVRRVAGRLVMRNEIYRSFVQHSSQLNLSAAPISNISNGLIVLPEDNFSHMSSLELREIAYGSYRGSIYAANIGSYRLSLAGFGAALEAVLLDFLSGIDATALNSAIGSARPAFRTLERPIDPTTWRLVNMIKVAVKLPALKTIAPVADGVREWRNLIHPALACANFAPEHSLEPEVRIASGIVCAVIRDIRALG